MGLVSLHRMEFREWSIFQTRPRRFSERERLGEEREEEKKRKGAFPWSIIPNRPFKIDHGGLASEGRVDHGRRFSERGHFGGKSKSDHGKDNFTKSVSVVVFPALWGAGALFACASKSIRQGSALEARPRGTPLRQHASAERIGVSVHASRRQRVCPVSSAQNGM